MDLTRPVVYRMLDLNDATATVGKAGLVGRSIEFCDMSTVAVDQYMDKKSQSDGMDFQGVGNLYMGVRSFEMRGTLYALDRTTFWTALDALRDILDPEQAYAEDQTVEGFLPLSFSVPSGTSGTISQFVLARPSGLRWSIDRDKQGSNAKIPGRTDDVALGCQWTCEWSARDPRVYGTLHSVALTGSGGSGSWTNAGDYPAFVDVVLEVGLGAGTIVITLGDNTEMVITLALGTGDRTVRYRGWTKLLTVVDPDIHATNEILRQDFLSFADPNSDTQHPLILPGATTYSVVATGVSLGVGSSISFTDAWA